MLDISSKGKRVIQEISTHIAIVSDNEEFIEIYEKEISPFPEKHLLSLSIDNVQGRLNIFKEFEETNRQNKEEFYEAVIDMEENLREPSKENGNKMEMFTKITNKIYTRADIIHAYTSGHHDGKFGITHANGLSAYREQQKL